MVVGQKKNMKKERATVTPPTKDISPHAILDKRAIGSSALP
jgi:hypothetical protein